MIKYFSILLAIPCILIISSCEQNDVTKKSENIPNATNAQITNWELTQNTFLGIKAFDPVNHSNGAPCQVRSKLPPWDFTYCRMLTEKQNIGGTLNRYGTTEEGNNSADFNFLMVLFPQYFSLYNLAENGDKDEWFYPKEVIANADKCGNDIKNSPFIWGEVAQPNTYIDNNFFFRRDDSHCAEGMYLHKTDTFGMYGVIVNDDGHGNQPEMHPVQQLWFRDKNILAKEKQGYWLLFFQDASDRFTDWIGSPLYGQFQIAFKVNPKTIRPYTDALTMDITLNDKSDLVTGNFASQRRDCDNGRSHSLIIDGKKMLIVNESGFDDEDMGIQFTELSKLPDGTIQGYVQVSLVIGDYDTDAFGKAIVSLLITQPKNILLNEDFENAGVKEK